MRKRSCAISSCVARSWPRRRAVLRRWSPRRRWDADDCELREVEFVASRPVGNYDFTDELQNGRIRLCIHALSRPANGNCDRADDAEEAGYCSVGPAAHATSREFLGTAARETPASRAAVAIVQSRPGEGQCRCKDVSGRFPIIRVIVVPTDRGAVMRGCKAGSGSFAVPIRPIAVPHRPRRADARSVPRLC